MFLEQSGLSVPHLPLSENIAYSSAHVETYSYIETYDFMGKAIKTPEPNYATVATGNTHKNYCKST